MDNLKNVEVIKAALTKYDNHGNQLIITIMKGIKQIDIVGVVIVISRSNECSQKKNEVFELQKKKKCKFLDSNSESQDAKNVYGNVVFEEMHCIFTITVLT